MDTHYDDPVQSQNEDWTREAEEDLFDDSIAESLKSPERISREKRFVKLYEDYMHPANPLSAFRKQCLLDDLYALLYELHKSWTYSACSRYRSAGFTEVDPEHGVSIGCSYVYPILKEDEENGRYCTYPVAHYLKIARYKTIDHYFRPSFKRLPPRKKSDPNDPQASQEPAKRRDYYTVNLESMTPDDNGVYKADRNKVLVCNPFETMGLSRQESDRKCTMLSVLYIQNLMDYPDEPQKPLALMYGSVIYLLAKEQEGTKLAETARNSSKLTSPTWAHQAMGNHTLEELGNISEKIVSKCYQQKLVWGEPFRAHMPQSFGDDTGRTWGEIVYTATYTVNDTSDWIESISTSSIKKSARQLVCDPELREFAEDKLSSKAKLRKAIARIENKKKKEASR